MSHTTNVQQLLDIPMPTASDLAIVFSSILRTTLRNNDLFLVIARNATEPDPAVCHTHDFCDANQAMIDALEALGRPYAYDDDAQEALIQEAWDIARARLFYI